MLSAFQGTPYFWRYRCAPLGVFFGRSAQRLTSVLRVAAGLEIASCRGIRKPLASASHPGWEQVCKHSGRPWWKKFLACLIYCCMVVIVLMKRRSGGSLSAERGATLPRREKQRVTQAWQLGLTGWRFLLFGLVWWSERTWMEDGWPHCEQQLTTMNYEEKRRVTTLLR